MPRKGRDIELLVEKIEAVALPDGATIKSPDYINDIDGGNLREVDISIRYKIGLTPILIIIECRDRESEDSTWIEQLISKRNSIKADKVIAVSTSRFSKPAIKKAKNNGIEIRLLKEIEADIIKGWFHLSLKVPYVNIELTQGYPIIVLQDDIEVISYDINERFVSGEKILKNNVNKNLFSVEDLMGSIIASHLSPSDRLDEMEDYRIHIDKFLPISDQKVSINTYIDFDKFEDYDIVYLDNNREIPVKMIILNCKVWREVENIPCSRRLYSSESENLMEVSEFDFNSEKQVLRFFRNVEDNSIKFTFEKMENNDVHSDFSKILIHFCSFSQIEIV